MLDAVRSLDWAPRSVRQKERALAQAYATLERTHGRPGRDEEVAALLGIDLEELDAWLTQVRGVSLGSLEAPGLGTPDGDAFTLHDLVATDAAQGPEARVQAHQRTALLAEAIDALPQQEKVVIALYYHEELTMKEIGQVLDGDRIAGLADPYQGHLPSPQHAHGPPGRLSALVQQSCQGFSHNTTCTNTMFPLATLARQWRCAARSMRRVRNAAGGRGHVARPTVHAGVRPPRRARGLRPCTPGCPARPTLLHRDRWLLLVSRRSAPHGTRRAAAPWMVVTAPWYT